MGIDEAVNAFGTLHAADWCPGLPRPFTSVSMACMGSVGLLLRGGLVGSLHSPVLWTMVLLFFFGPGLAAMEAGISDTGMLDQASVTSSRVI